MFDHLFLTRRFEESVAAENLLRLGKRSVARPALTVTPTFNVAPIVDGVACHPSVGNLFDAQSTVVVSSFTSISTLKPVARV